MKPYHAILEHQRFSYNKTNLPIAAIYEPLQRVAYLMENGECFILIASYNKPNCARNLSVTRVNLTSDFSTANRLLPTAN